MKHGSLFSGIGGFDLAAEWMGWENVFHVEKDPFCRKVLSHHFPKAETHEDIKTFDGTAYAGGVDIITGGFPCQPFSAAGKRAGISDDRYLWPEMFRIIREARPTYVVAENVRGLLSWNEGLVLDTVCSDLEGEGYEVCPVVLPAASVNAPHRRDRIWIVAYADEHRKGRTSGRDEGKSGKERLPQWDQVQQPEKPNCIRKLSTGTASMQSWQDFPTVAAVCGGDDGLPARLDGITFPKWRRESIKAYGNAIVPQVAYQIFKAL